jgi:hypothetical protein
MHSNIIEKYIRKVTKDMGIKQRNEVAKELKTHILDSADSIAAERKVKVDETIIKEVIIRMGSAETLAAMYPKERTLEDKVLHIFKVVAGFTFIFIVISSIIWTLLKIYFKNLQLNSFNIFIIIIFYVVLLAIYMIYKFKIFSKLFKN